MRREPDERVRRKPRRWRRMGMVAAAGVLSLAGCSSLDSGSTAQAPDPFLGPTTGPLAKTAVATAQPPPGAIAPGVLPAAAAPNTNVSVAALAPTSVHPSGDRDDLHIGSPRPSGQGWSAPETPAVATTGGQATLTPPDSAPPVARAPAPTALAQNTNPNPQPAAQQVSWPPPPPTQPANNTQPAPTQPPAEKPAPDPVPTSVDAASALLAKKGANFQPATQNAQTLDWTFRCVVPKANKIRTYEGHGRDQLSAMLAVLDEINQAQ